MVRSINLSLQQKFHQWTPSPARKLFFHTLASSLSHLQLPILTDKEKNPGLIQQVVLRHSLQRKE